MRDTKAAKENEACDFFFFLQSGANWNMFVIEVSFETYLKKP